MFLLSCFLVITPAQSQTQEELFNPSGLDIPRFVSLKSDKVFARKGPGQRFPIEWVYQKENLPVEIIQEFDTWRKIKDFEGGESWVHQSLLSGSRFGYITVDPYARLFQKNDENARVLALFEKGALISISACFEKWCKVKGAQYSGWIQKKDFWGVYESEQFQ